MQYLASVGHLDFTIGTIKVLRRINTESRLDGAFIEVHPHRVLDELFDICLHAFAYRGNPEHLQFFLAFAPLAQVFIGPLSIASVVIFVPVDSENMPSQDTEVPGLVYATSPKLLNRTPAPREQRVKPPGVA